MRRLLQLSALLLAAGLGSSGAQGQSIASDAGAAPPAPPTRVETELEAAYRPELTVTLQPDGEVAVGDTLRVTIVAKLARAADMAFPEQSLKPFEVLDRSDRTEPGPDGGQTHTFELELIAFEPAELELPALKLQVITPDGELGSAQTNARKVRVTSVLGNEPNAEPKPPSKPVVVMQDDYTLAWVGGTLLAALLLIAITLWVQRWLKRRPAPPAPAPPPRPPWDVALEKLDELARRQRTLLEQGRAEDLVDGVSDALREYLGGRYGFDGLECTTDETVAHLRRLNPRELTVPEVQALLGECDLVKFARAGVEHERCTSLLKDARQMVVRTRPATTGQGAAA